MVKKLKIVKILINKIFFHYKILLSIEIYVKNMSQDMKTLSHL